jgi:predicted HTH domain antitoxin
MLSGACPGLGWRVEAPLFQRYNQDGQAMPVTIPDEVLTAAHLTEPELRQELALTLFQQERLTLAQASRLAGMGQLAFQALLAERQIPIHYGVEEFRDDLRTLRQMGRL